MASASRFLVAPLVLAAAGCPSGTTTVEKTPQEAAEEDLRLSAGGADVFFGSVRGIASCEPGCAEGIELDVQWAPSRQLLALDAPAFGTHVELADDGFIELGTFFGPGGDPPHSYACDDGTLIEPEMAFTVHMYINTVLKMSKIEEEGLDVERLKEAVEDGAGALDAFISGRAQNELDCRER